MSLQARWISSSTFLLLSEEAASSKRGLTSISGMILCEAMTNCDFRCWVEENQLTASLDHLAAKYVKERQGCRKLLWSFGIAMRISISADWIRGVKLLGCAHTTPAFPIVNNDIFHVRIKSERTLVMREQLQLVFAALRNELTTHVIIVILLLHIIHDEPPVSLQSDFGAKIAIIGFLMFPCDLMVRSCWAELKYGNTLAVGVLSYTFSKPNFQYF